MLREVLTKFPLTGLVITGQLIFFTVFTGAVFWIFRKGSRPFYERLGRLPLGGEND